MNSLIILNSIIEQSDRTITIGLTAALLIVIIILLL
jgi:hypothetical protein